LYLVVAFPLGLTDVLAVGVGLPLGVATAPILVGLVVLPGRSR
jgi:hypothetical protein